MDLLLFVIILSAFVVVPGLINYYANRWRTAGGGSEPGRWELVIAGFTLSFALLTVAAMVVLVIALGWEGLREELSDFINMGFVGYAEERPFALSGVLTAISLVTMVVMGLLGVMRVPARFLK
ncbi:MAG: hypothetical protein QME71_00360 [Dehalococcoidia bacterium]|nr:hypothetical protein [Dehalococcoidia bacterium]